MDENTIIDRIDSDYYTYSLRSDGILKMCFKDVEELDVKIAKQSHQDYLKIVKGVKYPNLITFEVDYIKISAEARQYFATDEVNQFTVCDAIVINSIAMKLLANAYLKLNKPPKPTAVFNSEEKAIAWIKTFLSIFYQLG